MDSKLYISFDIGFANATPARCLPNVTLLFLFCCINRLTSLSRAQFSSILLEGFDFTTATTKLPGIPSHAIQFLSLIGAGVFATKVKNMRLYIMAASYIPAIIGTALMHTLPASNRWGRVVCVWIIYTGPVSLAVSFAVISGNFAEFAKTIFTLVLFAGYCVGNIVAPQFLLARRVRRDIPQL